MLHPELKALCDKLTFVDDRMEGLNQERDLIKSRDTWLRAVLLLFAAAMFVSGLFGVLDEGLTFDNGIALAIGVPAVYFWHRADKNNVRVTEEYESLRVKGELLVRQLQATHSKLRFETEDKLKGEMILVNWDGRPAISFSASSAYAILEPSGSWLKVDAVDVSRTGKVIPDTPSFYKAFSNQFNRAIIDDAISRAVDTDGTLDWLTYYKNHSVSGGRFV